MHRVVSYPLAIWLVILSCFISTVTAHVEGDFIPVSMNKVWPFNNPMETYSYYDALPVCHPGEIHSMYMTFGQIMRGDRLVNSLYQINFKKNIPGSKVCEQIASTEDIVKFQHAIRENYVFEIYVADLPINLHVGFIKQHADGSTKYFLKTGLQFILEYNGENQVVGAAIKMDNSLTDITELSPTPIVFVYSVVWEYSDVPTHARLQKQLAGALTPPTQVFDIHWLAIVNSFFLVVFIISFIVIIILRVVRSDLTRYLRIPDEELAAGVEEETGWKLLRADVFRPPTHRMWFCACVGSGAHLFFVVMTIVMAGCFSPYVERGTVLSSGLCGYMLTSFIAGYISANMYSRLGGTKWAWSILITAVMFMGPCCLLWSIINTVAISYSSTAALPFSTATFFFIGWLFVTLPLTVLGGVIGRKAATKQTAKHGTPFPCKTNKLSREIPTVLCHQSPWVQVIASGLLSFSAIYIELYYIFMSIWGTRIYTLYGVLFLAFIMLQLVAATVSILLTYFHLNAEDHRWWWRAFMCGGSVAIYFFLHCIFYFFTSTRMYGMLQITFFFGYSLALAWGLFLVMGFVTFSATYLFVYGIYSSIKSD